LEESGVAGILPATGAFLLLLRLVLTGSFDRWFAAGLAAMSAVYIASFYLAVTAPWTHFSLQIAAR